MTAVWDSGKSFIASLPSKSSGNIWIPSNSPSIATLFATLRGETDSKNEKRRRRSIWERFIHGDDCILECAINCAVVEVRSVILVPLSYKFASNPMCVYGPSWLSRGFVRPNHAPSTLPSCWTPCGRKLCFINQFALFSSTIRLLQDCSQPSLTK